MKYIFTQSISAYKTEIKQLIEAFLNEGSFIYNKRNQLKIFSTSFGQIIVKSYKTPFFINAFVYRYFRKPKAQRAFENAEKLIQLNINTPHPFFYSLNTTSLGINHSFFGYEYIEGNELRNVLMDNDYPNRKDILEKFTEFTFQMHEKKIWFKDHSPGNTLFNQHNNELNFYLIDINRLQFNYTFSLEKRLKNFSQLSAHPNDLIIIGNKYAQLINKNPIEIVHLLQTFSVESKKRRARKERIKKLIKPFK